MIPTHINPLARFCHKQPLSTQQEEKPSLVLGDAFAHFVALAAFSTLGHYALRDYENCTSFSSCVLKGANAVVWPALAAITGLALMQSIVKF